MKCGGANFSRDAALYQGLAFHEHQPFFNTLRTTYVVTREIDYDVAIAAVGSVLGVSGPAHKSPIAQKTYNFDAVHPGFHCRCATRHSLHLSPTILLISSPSSLRTQAPHQDPPTHKGAPVEESNRRSNSCSHRYPRSHRCPTEDVLTSQQGLDSSR